ncbi:MAG: DUF1963 domain-containing protein [Phycisphaerae bacterium]|nr:DUF1963 domain-containing protein [Phycisphaerae bacterium]
MSEELLESLGHAGLERVAEPIADAAWTSIRVRTKPVRSEDDLPLGVSKLGGRPDLLPGIEWPTWKQGPLDFLAQFYLPDLARFGDEEDEFLKSGWLLFFYDSMSDAWGAEAEERGSWRVIFQDGDASLLERKSFPASPTDTTEESRERAAGYAPCAVELTEEMKLPHLDSLFVRALDLTEAEATAYMKLTAQPVLLGERTDEEADSDPSGGHRLFGHPDIIQDDMQFDCELIARGMRREDMGDLPDDELTDFLTRAIQWRLLLQLDSDNNMGAMWGDMGALYFWIPEDQMLERNYEDVWMMLQCY